MEKTELKNIVILATGGTIAGKAASGTQMTGYTAGAYSVADLLAGVPELGELARYQRRAAVQYRQQQYYRCVAAASGSALQ